MGSGITISAGGRDDKTLPSVTPPSAVRASPLYSYPRFCIVFAELVDEEPGHFGFEFCTPAAYGCCRIGRGPMVDVCRHSGRVKVDVQPGTEPVGSGGDIEGKVLVPDDDRAPVRG